MTTPPPRAELDALICTRCKGPILRREAEAIMKKRAELGLEVRPPKICVLCFILALNEIEDDDADPD